jgi:hypothetical protein
LHPHLSFSLAGWQQITHMDSVGDFIRRWRQLGHPSTLLCLPMLSFWLKG